MVGIRTSAARRRGTTTVELAMVAPLLIFLLFGIIEFGLVTRDLIHMNSAASQAARLAAVGAGVAELNQAVADNCVGLNTPDLSTNYQYRHFDMVAATWGSWQTLTDGAAEAGDQIRIGITYQHELLFGSWIVRDAGTQEPGRVVLPIRTGSTITRE